MYKEHYSSLLLVYSEDENNIHNVEQQNLCVLSEGSKLTVNIYYHYPRLPVPPLFIHIATYISQVDVIWDGKVHTVVHSFNVPISFISSCIMY